MNFSKIDVDDDDEEGTNRLVHRRYIDVGSYKLKNENQMKTTERERTFLTMEDSIGVSVSSSLNSCSSAVPIVSQMNISQQYIFMSNANHQHNGAVQNARVSGVLPPCLLHTADSFPTLLGRSIFARPLIKDNAARRDIKGIP